MRTGGNKMLLFKSNFTKDIIMLLVVTILLSTVLSLVIGAASEYYFGDAVNSLLGDYKHNDVLLIIDKKQKKETITRIKQVLNNKLPGSKLRTGIDLAGKSNLFIALAKRHKTREVFVKLEDYFKDIEGVTTTSLMTEPRLTIEALKDKSSQLLAAKIDQLEHVAFTFPDGSSLEVVITKAQFVSQVKAEINKILDDYQMLGVRFPISKKVNSLMNLGAQIKSELKTEYQKPIYNVTEINSSQLDNLVKTMTEMKEFLNSYAATIKIKLFAGHKIAVGDKLIVPGLDNNKIDLRVNSVNDMIATALITTGDSSNIVGETVYQTAAQDSTTAVGKLEIDNPRQKLTYLVTELNKLMPRLNTIFTESNSLLSQGEKLFAILKSLQGTTAKITTLNQKLKQHSQDLEAVDGQAIKADLSALEQRLEQLVFLLAKLEFVRDLVVNLETELATIRANIAVTKEKFKVQSLYYKNLTQLENNIVKLKTVLSNNTQKIIQYINRYNPLLKEIKSWQQNVQDFNRLIDKLIKEPTTEFSQELSVLTRPNLSERLNKIRVPQMTEQLTAIKDQLAELQQINFAGITAKLEYIEQSLPKLKDEEITSSIDLLDHYLAGKAIPGEEISLLLSSQITDLTKVQEKIKQIIPQQISFYTSPMGVIVPNLRSQIYQILSEVKVILTAVTAVLCTVLSLLFDQGLIIASLQQLNKEMSYYHNPAFYYSLSVGIITLSSIIYLTGLKSPYLPWWSSLVTGAGLGIIIFKEAAVINDFALAEFKAGETFGFNYSQIMRQIIIPAAKPGLLKLLNYRQTYF
mgnify:CR=1 FL=1